VSQTITVSPASTLTASFTYSPSSPAAGQVVYFTDTSTGSPTSWQWNFGDSTTSTTRNPSHSYATAATYTVTLTVTKSSDSKSASQTVTVLPAFAASFTYSPSSPAIGQAVQFTDTSTGSPTAWQWNFGDSATSMIQNPSHTYAAAGSYWVNLVITKGADSKSTSQMITVRGPATITAASPSYADVKAAVDSAFSGDTVKVPAGTATWSSQLVITKGIFLIGAGIGQTSITSNYQAGSDYLTNTSYLIVYEPSNPAANEPFRLSGFTWDCGAKCHWLKIRNRPLSFVQIPNKIRIDHNRVSNCYPPQAMTFYIEGQVYGVADNNDFLSGFSRFEGLDTQAWSNIVFAYGTANNFYFEDNNIHLGGGNGLGDFAAYGNAGAMYCFRHNVITLYANIFPLFDAHGNASWTGTMGLEIYDNTINANNHFMSIADHRGGMGLIYNNTVSNTTSTYIQVREECFDSQNPPATGPNGQPQYVSNSYYWNNLLGSTLIDAVITPGTNQLDYGGLLGLVPQWNRECWKQVIPFDGTRGIGVGLLSARPSTCTTGVGYWATDTKKLYRAVATNTWAEYYQPFTYPHPLRTLLSGQVETEKR
jgi:PKD repeat protein